MRRNNTLSFVCLVAAVAVATSASPAQSAADLLAQMTLGEKIVMVHGVDGEYVGNTAPIERLGIPALTMNDGPQGFRSNAYPGSTTQFPAAINVAATFDASQARAWGAAMGQEFAAKGSNVALGPGLNVARVPVNGRNFEYLSGEDPFLGAHLVGDAVLGIQNQGVVATAKHFAHNNQEAARRTMVAALSERAQFELYLPPFDAAVAAGVGSVMCAYNNVSTERQQQAAHGQSFWACENPDALTLDLKERLGFAGWVMSDWGATHSTHQAAIAGLDQEMPGSHFFGAALQAAVEAGAVPESTLDDKVLRVLTPMLARGLLDANSSSARGRPDANVTSPAHTAVARALAAQSAVLLKNAGGLLPLSLGAALGAPSQGTLAVLGDAAALAPVTGGGGSGAVVAKHVVSLMEGIYARFGVNSSAWDQGTGQCTFEEDIEYYQAESPGIGSVASAEACCAVCASTIGCAYFTFDAATGTCWLKSSAAGRVASRGLVSGGTGNATSAGLVDWLTYVPTYNLTGAAAAAAAADVVIVAIGTNSAENSDRSTLAFSDAENALVAAAAAANPNTIVVAAAPGAVLLPWKDNVAAILLNFLAGEQAGNGLADVLWGDVSPSARLPVTLPNHDNEVNFTEAQYPGVGDGPTATYSEELLVGYRWYDAQAVAPAFPFGHGLSYAAFAYGALAVAPAAGGSGWSAAVEVTNAGSVRGAEVAQLYLAFPKDADEPPQQLKGIAKVGPLAPGAAATVTFALPARAFSTWDTQRHAWAAANGTFTLSVGASSRDFRATTTLSVAWPQSADL